MKSKQVRSVPIQFVPLQWRERLFGWFARGLVAATMMSALELVHVLTFFPPAASDAAGFIRYLMYVAATYAVVVGVLSVLFAALEPLVIRKLSWPNPARLAAVSLGVCAAALLIYRLDSLVVHGQHDQFPERVALMRRLGILIALVLGAVGARLVFEPLMSWLFRRLPNLSDPRVMPIVICVALAVVAVWTADFAWFAVHLDAMAALSGATATGLLLLATRWTWVNVSRQARRACGVIFLLLICGVPIGLWGSSHAEFVLYAHTPMAGSIAGGFRNLVDLDGDCASPAWLGGTDCAGFDRFRGPLQREVPGDGIDQDCSGQDARARREDGVAPNPVWDDCALPAEPLSVVFVTIDALRAGAVSERITPELTHFMKYTATFPRAYTPATMTNKAMISIYGQSQLSDLMAGNMVADRQPCLGVSLIERLRDAGYRTAYFNYLTVPEAVRLGFEEANPIMLVQEAPAGDLLWNFLSARITDSGLDYIERHRTERFFLWLHYLDTHAPYLDLLDNKFKDEEVSSYERVVAYVDHHVGRLLNGITKRRMASRVIIVVTADHGEDLGIRGREGHGPDIFEDTIRVPLMLWVPGCPARVLRGPVNLNRLGPTLGALTGIDVPGPNLFTKGEGEEPPVIAEALFREGAFSTFKLKRAVIGERYKLIVDVCNGGRMLFDLQEDPGETTNVYGAMPGVAGRLEAEYRRWLDRPRPEWLEGCREAFLSGESPGLF